MTNFSQATLEAISKDGGYYVYALANPDDGRWFYIGKGEGNRVFAHEADFWKQHQGESQEIVHEKFKRIQEIESQGKQVQRYIIKYGLTEAEAFTLESALIDVFGKTNLTNLVNGHGSGIHTVEDLELKFSAQELTLFHHDCILIKINQKWPEVKGSPADIYQATRSSWVLNPTKAAKFEYVLAVAFGLVREVYKPNEWKSVGKRWEFEGVVAPKEVRELYINKSVKELFRSGAANPVLYRSKGAAQPQTADEAVVTE